MMTREETMNIMRKQGMADALDLRSGEKFPEMKVVLRLILKITEVRLVI